MSSKCHFDIAVMKSCAVIMESGYGVSPKNKRGVEEVDRTKLRIFVIVIGSAVGLLSFFYLLADAAISYSDNARFCLNCHSMDEAYNSLQHSNHKQFKCTECHAPHSFLPKIVFKTKSGLRDLYVTTLGEVPQVIQATDESREIITVNCIRCHRTTVEQINMGQGRFCTDCHRDLVHDKREIQNWKEGV